MVCDSAVNMFEIVEYSVDQIVVGIVVPAVIIVVDVGNVEVDVNVLH